MTAGYTVKLETFEGPLDLLLSLIEERKMHISDVSLSAITDDYLSYLEEAENVHIRHTAEFLVVASTLVLIKSRSLLPSIKLDAEEEQSIEDLENQLATYKRYRDLSNHIKETFGTNIIFPRNATSQITPVFSPTDELTHEGILAGIMNVIKMFPKIEHVPQVMVKKMITLKEMIDSLTDRVSKGISVSFKEFSGDEKEKVNVVIGFLALLELVKKGIINANQDSNFSDIHMETSEPQTPKYY